MKLKLRKDTALAEDTVNIAYREMNNSISSIIELCDSSQNYLSVWDGDKSCQIDINDVFYAEWVDNKSCVCTDTKVYTLAGTLTSIEQRLSAAGFVRTSKAQIINIHKLKWISNGMNMKLTVEMKNGERLEISRHYRNMLIAAVHKLERESQK